jgi:hypothetical protein
MDKHKDDIMSHSQPRKELLKTFKNVQFDNPNCHDLKTLLLKKYINVKIHYWAKRISGNSLEKASKTVSGVLQK